MFLKNGNSTEGGGGSNIINISKKSMSSIINYQSDLFILLPAFSPYYFYNQFFSIFFRAFLIQFGGLYFKHYFTIIYKYFLYNIHHHNLLGIRIIKY